MIRSTCELARSAGATGVLLFAALLVGCAIPPLEPRDGREGHIGTPTESERKAAASSAASAAIPKPVRRSPVLPKPQPAAPLETYTVVVNGVPVRELLFALARDAALNVDIHPDVEGDITLNAIDQSLPQILDRLKNQVDLRYRLQDNLLSVLPDTPFLRTYKVDYVNLRRSTTNSVNVSTQIAATSSTGEGAGGGGDNNSETQVQTTATHDIWGTLTETIESMVADPNAEVAGGGDEGGSESEGGDRPKTVFANRETGLITVRATARQHVEVQSYLETVLNELDRQVLIEVTVVEVTLSDRYQAGIDWSRIPVGAGIALSQALIGGGGAVAGAVAGSIPSALANATRPFFFAQYSNNRDANGNPTGDLTVTASFLKEFGDVRVISSPKVMALNNQTAILKVVDNIVYFEVDVQSDTSPQGNVTRTIETTPKTVPVGFVMAVTPQINAADQVILNVRPTITRVLRFKQDPNPDLQAAVPNQIPELQVRELESVLQVGSGKIAVLGGLMQDQNGKTTDGLPLLSDIPEIGELFNFRDHNFQKTELVVFIRPWVIRNAGVLAGDLTRFQRVLPENLESVRPINSPPKEVPFQ